MMISIYKGIFLPTIVVTIENAHHNEANAKSSNDHYWSKTDIEEDLSENDRTDENNEPQTDNKQSSYEDLVRCN